MTGNVENGGRRRERWRLVPWAVATGLLLLPLVAMRFTDEVDWTASDFVLMGVMLYGCCAVFEAAARMTGNNAYRAGVAIAVLGAFLLTWINLAVGIVGNENNPINQMFFGVIFVGVIGAFIVRFRARGMARVLTAMAGAQGLASLAVLFMGHFTWVLAGFFCAIWLGSAELFRRAAEDQTAPA
jgi:hypothetical protein